MNRGRIADKIFKRKIEPTQTSNRRNLNRLLTFTDENASLKSKFAQIHCQKESYLVTELCQQTNTLMNQVCSIEELGIKIDL